jgi:hypothetical protein
MENKATELNSGIQRTIEQLANEADAARQSQLFRDNVRTSAAFWDYCWHNQMLIWRQKPDASFVGGSIPGSSADAMSGRERRALLFLRRCFQGQETEGRRESGGNDSLRLRRIR